MIGILGIGPSRSKLGTSSMSTDIDPQQISAAPPAAPFVERHTGRNRGTHIVERRRTNRMDLRLAAFVECRGKARVACEVRNISSMGALVVFSSPVVIPDRLTLSIPSESFEAICDVKHRSLDRLGLLFRTNRHEAGQRFASPYKSIEHCWHGVVF
jgi:hypothetical protein